MPSEKREPAARKRATRDYHPVKRQGTSARAEAGHVIELPADRNDLLVRMGDREVKLTNLKKVFWPDLGVTKRHLLQYYADVSSWLLPHLADRAMVMKRYPNGIDKPFFFMKRSPSPRPDWIQICEIEHESGNIINFPMIQDLPALLWVINLGCIDLNQWYARCDDVDRPDYLHFDLDPVTGTPFEKVRESALLVHQALESLKMPSFAKTTGSKGIHIYVPIERGPTQKQVWTFAKEIARVLESHAPKLVTAEYKVARRPKGRVLVDYNQNAWGRTLASIYSIRPTPLAAVSTPVTWEEVEQGISIEDFRIDNVPARLREVGDLWKPLVEQHGRFPLATFL